MLIDDIIATTSMSVISQLKAIMTVFKCFFLSGSAITPWPLGGAGKRTGKSGEHCLPF